MQIIADPPEIAAAFASSVTAFSTKESLVARNGDLSIFSAYRRIFPQASFELNFSSPSSEICLITISFTGLPARVA